jgi:type II secretory pathway component GspD/PulD (secretin)
MREFWKQAAAACVLLWTICGQTLANAPDDQHLVVAERLITLELRDTSLREALAELAAQAGITLITDDTLEDLRVTADFQNVRLEDALEDLALIGDLHWKARRPGVYIIGSGAKDARFFSDFAITRRYTPQHQSGQSLIALLPDMYREYVHADEESNILTITAPERTMPRLLEDIARIDGPSRQFVVEALVAEVTHDDGQASGFSWSIGDFGINNDLQMSYSVARPSDFVLLQSLMTQGRATLRANPRLTAFEGRQASITVGQDTYFVVLLLEERAYPRSQAQVIQTGVTLRFRGYISDDGWITLHLTPEVSDAVVNLDANPSTTVRRANTQVRVRSGETIAIGGLIAESQYRQVSRVPILGQIPLLGELFTQRRTLNRRTETVILITPRLSETGTGDTPPEELTDRSS